LFEEDLQPVNGRLSVPTEPGFGMTLSLAFRILGTFLVYRAAQKMSSEAMNLRVSSMGRTVRPTRR
jgi:hypothetical protein